MTAPVVWRPGEGDGADFGVVRFTVKAGTAETNGAYSLVEADGGVFATPHVHHDREESFYVLDGTIVFLAGEDRVEAGPGTFLLVPRETMHGFRAEGEARLLVMHSPAGFERFFTEAAEAIRDGTWSVEWRDDIARRLGMTYFDDVEI